MKKILALVLSGLFATAGHTQITPTIPTGTLVGNNTGSRAAPLALTATQATAMLNVFTSTLQGFAPASGGGTVKFLRADGTWTYAGPTIYVMAAPYNAVCDGSADDSAAIAAAITDAGSGGTVRLPDGKTCKVVTGFTVSHSDVHIIGGGSASTVIDYEPGANGTLFTISAGASEIFSDSIERLSITSSDTTHTKTGILVEDASRGVIFDVAIPAWTGGSGITNPCAGGTDAQGGSIGIRLCGREIQVVDQLYDAADRPIVLSVDPNTAGLAHDTLHLHDIYLAHTSGIPAPLIGVDTGVNFQDFLADGQQAWVGGTQAFQMNDTTGANPSSGMRFVNQRWEQATLTTMSSFVISNTSGSFTCTCTNMAVGQLITISGTYGGTGSITGYTNPTTYMISATNGTSTGTLKTISGGAVTTTAGTPSGLTYTFPQYMFHMRSNVNSYQAQFYNIWETAGGNIFLFHDFNGVTVNSFQYSDGGVGFNLDGTDADVNWNDAIWQNGSATNIITFPEVRIDMFVAPERTLPLRASYTDYLGYTDQKTSLGVKSTSSSAGIGYATGAGGTVTQATSRTTGVTLNTITGAITMFSAAGSATAATFTVTNSSVAATDTVIVTQKSGTNLYNFIVTAVAAGSFNITFYTTGGTATDAPVINFNVIKGVTS